MRFLSVRLVVTSALIGAGCGGSSSGPPKPLPELSAAPLTTEQTFQLSHAISNQSDLVPSDPKNLEMLLTQGFGDTTIVEGESIAAHTLDGSAPPAAAANPGLLVRFVHLADIQLADDESPARVVQLETQGATYAAYRPQEAWGCRMLNAAVRTINKVHETTPIEFVIQGGDNADNAQGNENAWFQAIMDGAASVKCDSGDPDDPTQGANNDPKDAFVAEGLKMPWKWVTGNHDVLNQGNFVISAPNTMTNDYTGTESSFGTIDWSKGTPFVSTGPVVADAARAPLDRTALMQAVSSDGDGHGLGAAQVTSGKAYYSFDVAGGKVRIVVMDTGAETGGADGVLHRADLMAYVKPALDDAETKGLYSIVMSHHGAPTLGTGDDLGGTTQSDAVLGPELETFLGGYPHLIMHLGAHTHLFRAAVVTPSAGHSYYEAETDSLADWPGEFRMFEIWDQGANLEIRATPIDFSDEGDPVVTEARRRQAAEYTSEWVDSTVGPGPSDARAISLWFPKPQG